MESFKNDIEKLEIEIKYLKHLYERAGTLSAKNRYYKSISCLTDIYTDLTKKIYPFVPRVKDVAYHNHFEKNRYDVLIDKISNKEYREMIEEICKNGTKIITKNQSLEDYYFKEKINYKTACEIILSFFKVYDKNLLPFIENILENNIFFCGYELEKLGYSVNVRTLNKSYIAIFTNKNKLSIEMLITLIHEIGHALYNKTLENRRYDITYNNFFEVISYYFEEVFKDYCIKNNIYSKECLKSQKNNLNYLHHSLEQLRIINQFIDKLRFNSKDIVLKITKKDLEKIDYLDIDNKPLKLDNCDLTYAYTFGLLLSFYYLQLYKKDPDKTKKLLYQFMLGIGVYEDSYIFNNFGLNSEEIKNCNFLEPIIKENQKQLRKNTQI